MELANSSLTDLIFSWSLSDILNSNLFKNQVGKIPNTFKSVEHYLNSFVNPLIEEAHADLLSGLKGASQAPTSQIFSITEPRGYRPSRSSIYYEVIVEAEVESTSKKETYKPQTGDVILLSTVRSPQLNYYKRSPGSFILAIFVKGSTDRIRASRPISEYQKRGSVYAVYLMNATTNIRIWEALKQKTRQSNLSIFNEVLDANSTVGIDCDRCASQIDRASGNDIGVDLSSFNLNESQTRAVLSSIETSRCNHKNTIKLIWGPPGTGKTKTVSTLLWALLEQKCRTLTCAPTNTAVVEVTSRLLKLLKESLGHDWRGLGDVLLFGNQVRMKIDENDDLFDVFLDYRVRRLEESSSNWEPNLVSMISLLEDPTPIYLRYVESVKKKQEKLQKDKEKREQRQENEEDHSRNRKGEGADNEKLVKILPIGEFFRKKFRFVNKDLQICITSLCTNLPTSFISKDVAQHMKMAEGFLDHIETLLTSDEITDIDLKKLSIPSSDKGSNTLSELLHNNRAECVRILTFLRKSLSVPEFGDTNSIKEFCLQNACLIFCTASTSSTLQTEEMKPLKMLVIDEAAQLKECESVVPLLLPGIQHAILVGDECQLPAMIKSQICMEADFGRSMFERLVLLGQRKHLLDVQYRMHPAISLFPNSMFYGNRISDASSVRESIYKKDLLQGNMYGPYSFINVAYGNEVLVNGHSPRNPVESAVVSKIVAKLYEAASSNKQKISVGIISPYKSQVFLLQKELGDKYETDSNFSLSIRSVDGFQGGEEDVIIISTVRSNEKGSVGFLDKHQRTNVALTRARYCLWIVGNEQTLLDSDTVWTKLVLDAKDRGCSFNAENDNRLVDGIAGAMIELEQLDKLLDMNSVLFKGAKWKVVFEDSFQQSIERIKEVETRKEVVSLLKKLSNGWRDPSQSQENVNIIDGASQLLRQYSISSRESLNLIWSVDILEESSKYIQVLKFWDILSRIGMLQLEGQLKFLFRNYTADDIYRRSYKCLEGELEVPMSWEISEDMASPKEVQEPESLDLSDLISSLDIA